MEPLGLGLALAVGLLLVKEAGVPVPVPGDLVVIGLGVGAAQGQFEPALALGAIVAATILGGSLQYALLRGPGRRLLLGTLRRLGVPDARIEAQADRFRRRGAPAVAVARMTPGIRIVAIAAAAIAAIPFGRFLAGLSVGNAVFTSGHFALGLAFGAAAPSVAAGAAPVAVGLVLLAVVGMLGWRWLARRRRSAGTGAASGPAWADACCPACLALAGIADRS
jgi:membrane protein DedA with SNARE-associated domain